MSLGRNVWLIAAAVLAAIVLLLVATGSSQAVLGLDSDRLGRLVAVAAWGTLVGAGILMSRRRFGDMARQLAGWLAIILLLVAGYEYRYELQDFASRVTGGMIAASPLGANDAQGRPTVTLAKSDNGHFQARLRIDGVSVNALVDTGATATVLTAGDASRIGFDVERLSYSIPVGTANGTARAARVVAREVSVGTITRRNMPLFVAEPGRLDTSLLGMSFIGTLSSFDIRGDRLILRD